MVISILNPKGGSGKTTLATNLSRSLQGPGEVLLLDLDPQQSAMEWAERNPQDYPSVVRVPQGGLLNVIPRVRDAFDHIVIDGAAIMEQHLLSAAIKAADIVLIPVRPSGLDIWGCADLVKLVHARQLLADGRPGAAFIVSLQVQGTRFSGGVQERLEQMALPVFAGRMTRRVEFAEAVTAGLSVLDHRPGGKGAQEIRNITDELLRFFHASS